MRIAVAMDGVRDAVARVVAQASAGGPIRTEHVRADQFVLGGYGVAVLTLVS